MKTSKTPDVSIIIPTYNRPKELRDCLESILIQTVKPMEVIVIDDGNLGGPPLQHKFSEAGVKYVYLKKDRPGLTESRNNGIRLACGKIIFFLDDDVILFPNYVEQILSVYMERKDFTAGVGGLEDNKPPMRLRDYFRYLFKLLFLNSGLQEGKILPSGFCTQFGESPFPLTEITPVDFLCGCACSFDRKIFEEYSFTEQYREFGMGEDKDFTVMVSRRYPLFINPKARLVHLEAAAMRPQDQLWAQRCLMGNYLIFRRHIRQGWWNWPIFWYAVTGQFIARCLALAIFPNKRKLRKLKGMVDAVRLIINRQIPDLGNVKK